MLKSPAVFLLGVFAIGAAPAAEVDGFFGRLNAPVEGGVTYTWGVEYRQDLNAHLAASLAWLNEGHLRYFHRDGQAVQLWWRNPPEGPGLRYEIGVGPYLYYDTSAIQRQREPEDVHGLGVAASAAIDWVFHSGRFAGLRLNRVEVRGSFPTTAVALEYGYRFADERHSPDVGAGEFAPRWEADALLGQRVANGYPESTSAAAAALGARVNLNDHLAASLTYVGGADLQVDWNGGIAAQLWLQQHLTGKFTVGVGAGGLFITRRAAAPADSARTLPMVGITAAYSLSACCVARAVWGRAVSSDDRDSDIFLLGLGFPF